MKKFSLAVVTAKRINCSDLGSQSDRSIPAWSLHDLLVVTLSDFSKITHLWQIFNCYLFISCQSLTGFPSCSKLSIGWHTN